MINSKVHLADDLFILDFTHFKSDRSNNCSLGSSNSNAAALNKLRVNAIGLVKPPVAPTVSDLDTVGAINP